jgi:hypothetical protein
MPLVGDGWLSRREVSLPSTQRRRVHTGERGSHPAGRQRRAPGSGELAHPRGEQDKGPRMYEGSLATSEAVRLVIWDLDETGAGANRERRVKRLMFKLRDLQTLHHCQALVTAWVVIHSPDNFEAESAVKIGRLEVVCLQDDLLASAR